MTHREKVEKWKAVIQSAETSGIPIRHWCKEQGIDIHRYYYWHKVIVEECGTQGKESEETVPGAKAVPMVAEVRFKKEDCQILSSFSPHMMIVRNDCQVFVEQAFNPATLKMVLEVITGC